MATNSIQDQLYSQELIYAKEGIKIFKKDGIVTKVFDSDHSIDTLTNKKKKLYILKGLQLNNFSCCYNLDFNNPQFSYYEMSQAVGEQVLRYKGYKYSIEEKVKILSSVYNAICEAHDNNIIINDIHGRNFFFDKYTGKITGIDLDNFQVNSYFADQLPDFIYRFVESTTKLSEKTDMIAFALMILDILGPKDVDLDLYKIPELLEYVESLDIPGSIKNELYDVFNFSTSNIEYILSGLSSIKGKVLLTK